MFAYDKTWHPINKYKQSYKILQLIPKTAFKAKVPNIFVHNVLEIVHENVRAVPYCTARMFEGMYGSIVQHNVRTQCSTECTTILYGDNVQAKKDQRRSGVISGLKN